MNNPTRKIHTVSQCLLRRFVDPTAGQLMVFDLIGRRERPKSTAAVGYVRDFIIYEPDQAETVWEQIETLLPDAFAAIDDGTIFTDRRHVDALTDCIALHWARSEAYKDIHLRLLDAVIAKRKRVFREQAPHLLATAFTDKYHGLLPAGPRALDHINDLIHDQPEPVIDGSWFSQRVQYWFRRAAALFRTMHLEIGDIVGPTQLLIADNPTLAPRRDATRAVTELRAPLTEAGTVILPVGPRHVLALGPRQRRIALTDQQVREINRLQVLAAQQWIAYHPSATLRGFIEQVAPARPLPTTA